MLYLCVLYISELGLVIQHEHTTMLIPALVFDFESMVSTKDYALGRA